MMKATIALALLSFAAPVAVFAQAETQITSDPANDQRPAWSPDETQIAFDSDRAGNPDLWVVPSTGGAATALTTHPLLDRHGDWSPDGTQLAFSSRESGGPNADIWLVPATGGATTLLIGDAATDDRFPAWSPDGLTVAFTKGGDIYTVPATGGVATQITTDPAEDVHPTWSPDGASIAFTSSRSGNNDIWVIPATGGAAVQITTDLANDSASDWSPDGDRLAFQSIRSGNNDIWLIPSSGGPATQVTTDPGIDVQPDWSATGDRIAFARDGNIWVFEFPTDLGVTVSVDDPTPSEGATIVFTIDVTNGGPQTATGVGVAYALPSGLTYQSDSATLGTYDLGTGIWTIGNLTFGPTETLTITATVDPGTNGLTLPNTAVASGDLLDRTPGNDSATVDVTPYLAITSAADQAWLVSDPTTPIEALTVTDNATTPQITATNDIRVRIPAGFAMDWDTADVTATIGGSAAANVSATVSYEDVGKTLVIDVVTDFAASDQITVSDLGFTNFTAASPTSFLELELTNDGGLSGLDDKFITIVTATSAIEGGALPTAFALSAPQPNPSRDRTVLHFDVPARTRATLSVFDVSGRLVKNLLDKTVEAGRHAPIWDGRDTAGRRVSAGVYFVRFDTTAFSATRRVVRLR